MQEQHLLITSHVTVAAAKLANCTAAVKPYKLPDKKARTLPNSAKNLHSSMLPLKLKESIQHWISKDRSHQHEMCHCSYQVCLVVHKLLHHTCTAQYSPFGNNLLESRTFETFFGTFKFSPFFVLLVQIHRGRDQSASARRQPMSHDLYWSKSECFVVCHFIWTT